MDVRGDYGRVPFRGIEQNRWTEAAATLATPRGTSRFVLAVLREAVDCNACPVHSSEPHRAGRAGRDAGRIINIGEALL